MTTIDRGRLGASLALAVAFHVVLLLAINFLVDLVGPAMPEYTGRVTVPVLWDRQTGTIVSNESREIIRMLDKEFEMFAENKITFCPEGLQKKIDDTIDAIYAPINDGVYRAGFSTTQEAYEEAAFELFAALDSWESIFPNPSALSFR